jgi:flavodoxin
VKTLVIYDSAYGNTAQVAQAIGSVLGSPGEVTVRQVGQVQPEELVNLDLLIVGSPTQGFRPTEAITKLLTETPPHTLQGVNVAAFDTRIAIDTIKSAFLRFVVNLGGYAAKPIAKRLVKQGGMLVAPPEGFFVEGKEGPLKAGELDRAMEWAKKISVGQAIPA